MKQQKLFVEKTSSNQFGGQLLRGKRKSQRPLSFTKPMHLVLRSKKTNNKIFFSPRDSKLIGLIKKAAHKYNACVYRFVPNHTHIHFVLLVNSRKDYVNFVRHLGAQIVALLSSRCGSSLKGLFELRPFTRIVSWGKDFKNCLKYLTLNILEATGSVKELSQIPDLNFTALPILAQGP